MNKENIISASILLIDKYFPENSLESIEDAVLRAEEAKI